MNGRLKKRTPRPLFQLIIGALAVSTLSLTGCSDDANDNPTDIITSEDVRLADAHTDTGADANASDSADADAHSHEPDDANTQESDADDGVSAPDVDPFPACPQTPCSDELICVDGRCLEDTPANKCAAAEDLGTLSPGAPITLNDTTAGASDILRNACSGGDGVEQVYQFTVSEKSRVSFEATWPAQFDASVAFRFDGCESPGDALCFDSNSSVSVDAGETVYLVVEQYVGRGNDFTLELNATPQNCAPGESSCSDGILEVCSADGSALSYECADTCTSAGDQCEGGLCENAIAVSSSASFSGDLAAYPSHFDFEFNENCSVDGSPVQTPGSEVIFKLESLNADQVVSITAGSNRAMFFMTDCQATPVCEATMTGSGTAGTAEWTVPAGFVDQDVYLVIDRRTHSGGDFTYEIDISTP